MLPLGLLYVSAIIERCGHKAKIIDPYLDDVELKHFDCGDFDKIDTVIEDYAPAIIGYSGIATSYGRTKRLSLHIKNNHPQVMQVAGGALSSVYELLLTKTGIDAVFHGEAEVSLPIFLERFEQKESAHDVPGISFLLDGKKAVKNYPAEQVNDIDTIPFPAYHLIDVNRYLHPIDQWLAHYEPILKRNPSYGDLIRTIGPKTHYIPIVTARGCTHKCIFCYRHVRGVRQHSVSYVIEHIKYLKETYGIGGFGFSDELFNSRYEWVMELCDEIEKNNLDIFYLVGGARVNKIDEKILRRLKQTGCISIEYGQESGSDFILKEYKKGTTSQQNKEITKLTQQVGIHTVVQLVIGSPGETTSTIYETIRLLKDVDAYQYSLNYLIPLPETPIWQYVTENELVQDVEHYLDLVAEYGGTPLVNLTKASDNVWIDWSRLIPTELRLHYLRRTGSKRYYTYKFLLCLINVIAPLIPLRIKRLIPAPIKSWLLR